MVNISCKIIIARKFDKSSQTKEEQRKFPKQLCLGRSQSIIKFAFRESVRGIYGGMNKIFKI